MDFIGMAFLVLTVIIVLVLLCTVPMASPLTIIASVMVFNAMKGDSK